MFMYGRFVKEWIGKYNACTDLADIEHEVVIPAQPFKIKRI